LTQQVHLLYNVIIMSNALISIRTDDKTKKDITIFANSVGLSVSAFVTVILKQAMQEGRVILTPELEPTPYLEKVIYKAQADLASGLATPPFDKLEARKHLRSLMKK
jgi:antitoxin component of RelBE/YafQ-DinJ toxin-antitoxin module